MGCEFVFGTVLARLGSPGYFQTILYGCILVCKAIQGSSWAMQECIWVQGALVQELSPLMGSGWTPVSSPETQEAASDEVRVLSPGSENNENLSLLRSVSVTGICLMLRGHFA